MKLRIWSLITALSNSLKKCKSPLFVHPIARYCSKQTLVGGDKATKHWFPATLGSLNVAIVCPAGTVFSFNITGGGVFRCNKGSWGVQGVPDCVGYVNKNGSCPVATRPVAHQYTKQVLCGKRKNYYFQRRV